MARGRPPASPIPYEMLSALPDDLVGEIIDGEFHTQLRPTGPHSSAERGLLVELGGFFGNGRGNPGGWWILPEPEIHFVRGVEVVVPDLAGWKREHLSAVPDDHRMDTAPDWVCEILAPSTAKKDRAVKLPLYARRGVTHIWLVDPLVRILEGFERHGNTWLLRRTFKDDDPVCLAPFDAISFSLSNLWP